MIWLWRFFSGYLTIVFCGDKAERILNAATKNHIELWNLRYKKGEIIGNISVKNFYQLRVAKRGIKCKIKIIKRSGLRFYINKHINRVGFFSGVAVFFIILQLFSNFIWVINVEGNKTLSTKEIYDSCKAIGITECILKSRINNKYDAQKLLLQNKKLAWASLNIEGCVLTVNISEAETSEKYVNEFPSNIKASTEGKISRIDVNSGNVLVKVGDNVSKGDLLVSGITEKMSSTLFVHSSGTINAVTTKTLSSQGEYRQNLIFEDKNYKKRTAVEILGLKLPLYLGTVKESCKKNTSIKKLKLFNKSIPIKIATEKIFTTFEREVLYSDEELTTALLENIKSQIEKLNLISYEEKDRKIISDDRGIKVEITYNCIENIAVQDKILLDNNN